MRSRQSICSLFHTAGTSRHGIYGLRSICKNGKAMVDHGTMMMLPEMFVWDLSLSASDEKTMHTTFISLHVVVWTKRWNGLESDRNRLLVKFRPATPEELAVETVMNE